MYNQGYSQTPNGGSLEILQGGGGVLKVREVQSTPFIADTVGTSS